MTTPDPGVGRADPALRRVTGVLHRYADEVDAAGRFPAESVAALRAEGLLALLVPEEFGGAGAELSRVAETCLTLGRACGSTAMIFAMHQIQVACLVAHGRGQPAVREFLREVAGRQPLIASGTSEQGGGDIRRSQAALEPDGPGYLRLHKEIGTVSYGEQAGALLVTARRTPEAVPGDQVLVLLRRDHPDDRAWTRLEPTRPWQALGLRGTGSIGATLRARTATSGMLETPFAGILATTMLPVSHVLWSAVWLGIAAGALERAGRHLRGRRAGRTALPRGYAEQVAAYHELSGFCRYQAARLSLGRTDGPLAELRDQVALNSLKVRVSTGVVEIVVQTMAAVGLEAYLLDTEVSLGRHLRDLLSAPLMIRNDRLLDSVGSTLSVLKDLD